MPGRLAEHCFEYVHSSCTANSSKFSRQLGSDNFPMSLLVCCNAVLLHSDLPVNAYLSSDRHLPGLACIHLVKPADPHTLSETHCWLVTQYRGGTGGG